MSGWTEKYFLEKYYLVGSLTCSKIGKTFSCKMFEMAAMAICFVYVNLPTVLLMYFNNLASCLFPNINLS